MPDDAPNLYVHFPFCRGKCEYCALHSRAGASASVRAEYVARLADAAGAANAHGGRRAPFRTIYFGGGSPALCDLRPLFAALAPRISQETEFTVELHPLDATRETLAVLADGGVNRVSMGVQSIDDATLRRMGRGHTADDAERAFALVKSRFDNAGIDLIAGYPGSDCDSWAASLARLRGWGLRHCSVYSLILEPGSILGRKLSSGRIAPSEIPDDDSAMDAIRAASRFFASIGLARYEISNYAAPGFECRHNLAVWRGEDYVGLGEGAHGRLGLFRTQNWFGDRRQSGGGAPQIVEELDAERDAKERAIFRLRTRDGIDCSRRPEWAAILDRFAREGFLAKSGAVYRLTARGAEVCDSILAELV